MLLRSISVAGNKNSARGRALEGKERPRRLVEDLDAKVTEPDVIAVILKPDQTADNITLVVAAKLRSQKLKRIRPIRISTGELTILDQSSPLGSPKVVLYDRLVVLIVDNSTLKDHNTTGVPFPERLSILRLSRQHIVQRSAGAVTINAQFGVGVVLIVEDLVLGSSNVNGPAGNLASVKENARVRTASNLPFECELEVLERSGEDDISVALADTVTGDLHSTVLNAPTSGNIPTTVKAPTVEVLTVEDGNGISSVGNHNLLGSNALGVDVGFLVVTPAGGKHSAHEESRKNNLYFHNH